jgi:hypothetical protein
MYLLLRSKIKVVMQANWTILCMTLNSVVTVVDPDPLVRGADPDPHKKNCQGSETLLIVLNNESKFSKIFLFCRQ